MRNRFLLLMALCLAVGQSWAERIDVATAREVARTVASRGSTLRSAGELSLVYAAAPGQTGSALRSASAAGEADYFVFNVPGDGGFVIVSGDDRVRPVLGYSHAGSFDPDNLPENLRGMLAFYQEQITWAEDNAVEASPAISAEWSQYQSGTALRAAESVELSKETASWDQSAPFNAMCPMLNGERTLTGCGATATAIIMKYHQWPDQATDGVTAHPSAAEHPEWKCGPLDYTSGYNWSDEAMPLVVNGEAEVPEIAKLMWHIGANVDMEYKDGASSSSMDDIVLALQDVFGYSHASRAVQKDYYAEDEWEAMIRKEIDADRPVLYRGRTAADEGHLFVCEGYNSDHYYKINWGWGGSRDNYFLLSALGEEESGVYNLEQWMAVGLKKDGGEQPIYELHYEKAPESSQIPLPVNEPFSLNLNLYNSGSRTSSYYVNVAIYDLESGQLGEPLRSGSYSLREVEPNHGWYVRNDAALVIDGIQLSSALQPWERLVVIYSRDNSTDWQILKGASDAYYAFDRDSLASMDYEGGDALEANVSTNSLDDTRGTVGETVFGYVYCQVSDLSRVGHFVYELEDPSWADSLTIWFNNDSNADSSAWKTMAFQDGKGIISFSDCAVDESQSLVKNYLNVRALKAGTVNYKIHVYDNTGTLCATSEHSFVVEEVSIPLTLPETISGDLNAGPVSFEIRTGDVGAFAGQTIELEMQTNSHEDTALVVSYEGTDYKFVDQVPGNGVVQAYCPLTLESDKTYAFSLTGKKSTEGASFPYMYFIWRDTAGNVLPVSNSNPVLLNLTYVAPLTAKITTNSLDDTRGAVGETVPGHVYCQVSDLSRVGHFVYELADSSWADSLTIWYNNDSNADLSEWKAMDFKDGKGTILFSDCAVDSSMSLVKNYLNVRALKAGTVNYKIHVYDDAGALCATSEHSFVVEEVSIPLTLPETISGDLNAGPVSFEIRTGDVGAFAGQTIELEMQTNSHEDAALVVSYEGTDYKFVDEYPGNGVVQAYCPLTLESDKTYTFSLTGKKSTEGASFPYMYFIWRDTAGNVLPVSNSNPVLLDLKYVNVIPAGEEETLEGAVDAIEIGSDEGGSSSSDTSKVVLNGVTTPEITVKEEAKAVLTLSGTNNLGTVTNQGTLIIEVDEESSEVPVSLTVSITNNGVLTDYTGQVTNVEGEASLQINKIGEQEIDPDASVTLTATAVIAEGATVTFQWQWFNVNTNNWVDVPNDEASAQAAAMLRAATTTKENYLEVSAADAGNYRCLVTSVATVDGKDVSTTLTTYATVSVKDPDPTPGPDPTPTPTTYIVTLPVVEGATIEAIGSTSVKAGESFSFTVTVKEGYVATNMVVKANGVTLTPNADGRYTISDVRSNVVVTVTGIEEDPATAIESVDASGLKVWAADGRLFIQTPRADKAYVVTFDGRLYKALDLPAGETVTPMPQGAYIIYVGELSFKVVL